MVLPISRSDGSPPNPTFGSGPAHKKCFEGIVPSFLGQELGLGKCLTLNRPTTKVLKNSKTYQFRN